MKKLRFWTIALALLGQFATANDNVSVPINQVFERLNKERVTTGLLSDYGVQLIDIAYYNGTLGDSNFVDMDSHKQLYVGLYTSKVNNRISLSEPANVNQRIDSYNGTGNTPVSVMHYSYNRFKPNAVAEGAVRVVNNQILDVEGKNPYETCNLFAVAPRKVEFHSGTVSFVFPRELALSNSNVVQAKLFVRFDEGLPFQSVNWDVPVLHTYKQTGVKKLQFKVVYPDGRTFLSQTNIWAKGIESISPRNKQEDLLRENITIAATSKHSGGTIQIRYNDATRRIRKALVIAEGFEADIAPKQDIETFLASRSKVEVFDNKDLLFFLDSLGYSIVYVNNNNGTDDIRRNAALFEEALDLINSPQYKDGDYPNVVMGFSMGGLVARYALRKMELANKPHHTWKYISVDSPHRGANIPVGYQAMLRHVGGLQFKLLGSTAFSARRDVKQVGQALQALNSKAARQMLIYYVGDDGTSINSSEYTRFMEEYHALGMPRLCQNVAITNGALNGKKLFEPGADLINLDAGSPLLDIGLSLGRPISAALSLFSNYPQMLLNLVPGISNLRVHVSVKSIGYQPLTAYRGRIVLYKKALLLIPMQTTLEEASLNTSKDLLPIDGAQGGMFTAKNYPKPQSNLLLSTNDFMKQQSFCFIPTVSALDMKEWRKRLDGNTQYDFYASGQSDFEHWMIPDESEGHVSLATSASRLMYHLKDKPLSPKTEITGYTTAADGYTITVNNPTNTNVAWYSTNSSFQGQNGTIYGATYKYPNKAANTVAEALAEGNTYRLRRRIAYLVDGSYVRISNHMCERQKPQAHYQKLHPNLTVNWSIERYIDVTRDDWLEWDKDILRVARVNEEFSSVSFERLNKGLTTVVAKPMFNGQCIDTIRRIVCVDMFEPYVLPSNRYSTVGNEYRFRKGEQDVLYVWKKNASIPIEYAYIKNYGSNYVKILKMESSHPYRFTVEKEGERGIRVKALRGGPGTITCQVMRHCGCMGELNINVNVEGAPESEPIPEPKVEHRDGYIVIDCPKLPNANLSDGVHYIVQLWNDKRSRTISARQRTLEIPTAYLPKGVYVVRILRTNQDANPYSQTVIIP